MPDKIIADTIKNMEPWFHNIHLPGGETTAPNHPLGDFPSYKWEVIDHYLPEDLTGCKVLDIGCNAGYYSVKCALKGATVTAIDIDPHYLNQAKWVVNLFNLQERIKFYRMQVYDLVKMDWEFDIVLFLGVFYHLRYPLLAIDIVSEKVKDMLVFQSLSLQHDGEHPLIEDIGLRNKEILLDKRWPSLAFIEKMFMGDPTNWWVPNAAAVKAMFRTAGMELINCPGQEVCFFKPDKQNQSVVNGWNRSEFLSATGRPWENDAEIKIGKLKK